METTLARNWWAIALRGAVAIVFAFAAYFLAAASVQTLARIFGLFALLEGLLAAVTVLGGRHGEEAQPRVFFVDAVLGVGFGLVALLAPWRSGAAVVQLVAGWIGLMGLLEASTALRFRKHVGTPRLLVALGVVSLLFAAVLAFVPFSRFVNVWFIGTWAAFVGALYLVVGIILRRDLTLPEPEEETYVAHARHEAPFGHI